MNYLYANFRGSSGFGKAFAEAGKRQWGGAMQDDLGDALAYLVEQGLASADRACIVGGSYGGYAALAAATLTPDLFRCAVSIAGISDLPAQLKADRKRMRDDDEAWDYMKRQIGDPSRDKAMLQARSSARLAAAVKIPILLVHGEDDSNVPIEHSEIMEKALRKSGREVEFLRLPDTGHDPDDEALRRMYPAVLAFLEKHLLVTVAPGAPEGLEAP